MVESLLATAQRFFSARKWAEASEAYKAVTAKMPENARAWSRLGHSFRHQGRLAESLVAHKKAAELPGGGGGFSAIYNIACIYAVTGEKDKAFKWLSKAVRAGFKDTAFMAKNRDMDSLRDDPRYAKIIVRMKR